MRLALRTRAARWRRAPIRHWETDRLLELYVHRGAGALGAEALHGLLVPFDAASEHSIELCHALLDAKRLCENRVPPV